MREEKNKAKQQSRKLYPEKTEVAATLPPSQIVSLDEHLCKQLFINKVPHCLALCMYFLDLPKAISTFNFCFFYFGYFAIF